VKLLELQAGIQDYVLKLDEGITPQIQDSGELSAMARMEIYAEAYRLRLVEALTVQYPGLSAWMGSDDFERLAIAYIDAHPSRHFSVRWFGGNLDSFLSNTPSYSESPILAEMARFEWLLAYAFDAADVPPVRHEDLTAIPAMQWPNLLFSFHPSLGRMDCRWNTVPIWQALINGREPPGAEQAGVAQVWLVWRTELATRFRAASSLEAEVLDCARSGATFTEQCTIMAQDMDAEQAAAELAAMLGSWVRDGIITGMKTAA
jgi:hypothetical protein